MHNNISKPQKCFQYFIYFLSLRDNFISLFEAICTPENDRHLNFFSIHSFILIQDAQKNLRQRKQKLDKLNIHTKNSPEEGHRPHNKYKKILRLDNIDKEKERNKLTDGAENANKIRRRKCEANRF